MLISKQNILIIIARIILKNPMVQGALISLKQSIRNKIQELLKAKLPDSVWKVLELIFDTIVSIAKKVLSDNGLHSLTAKSSMDKAFGLSSLVSNEIAVNESLFKDLPEFIECEQFA